MSKPYYIPTHCTVNLGYSVDSVRGYSALDSHDNSPAYLVLNAMIRVYYTEAVKIYIKKRGGIILMQLKYIKKREWG